MSRQRHIFELPTVRYVILFWNDEQKYEFLSSSSTFFKSGTDPLSLKEGSEVELKDGSLAKIIAVGENPEDVKKLLDRLEKRLTEGNLNSSLDSLGFLNSSRVSHADVMEEDGSDSESEDEGPQAAASSHSPENDLTSSSQPSAKELTLQNQSSGDEGVQVQLLRIIVRQNKALKRTMDNILKEVTKANKLSKSKQKTNSNASGSTPGSTMDSTPVIFNGVDLMKCARRNASASLFGSAVARVLWTDTELAAGRIGTCHRNSGREPLDDERQKSWYAACQQRFGDNEDMLFEAISAVNQLGLDIKNGRRSRKSKNLES